jgi:hypothetical protein
MRTSTCFIRSLRPFRMLELLSVPRLCFGIDADPCEHGPRFPNKGSCCPPLGDRLGRETAMPIGPIGLTHGSAGPRSVESANSLSSFRWGLALPSRPLRHG